MDKVTFATTPLKLGNIDVDSFMWQEDINYTVNKKFRNLCNDEDNPSYRDEEYKEWWEEEIAKLLKEYHMLDDSRKATLRAGMLIGYAFCKYERACYDLKQETTSTDKTELR